MKHLIIVVLGSLLFYQLKAQSFNEFFKQKETQREYLLQQIIALKTYGNYLRRGYDIAHDGLGFIKQFKNGEFILHQDYYESLRTINPVLAKNHKVKEITDSHHKISLHFSRINNDSLSGQEWPYINNVMSIVLKESTRSLSDLKMIVTSGNLQANDNQRLKMINKLYKEMNERLNFCKSFVSDVKIFQNLRKQEEVTLNNSLRLFNLTK
ncbi:hypothetical protein [Pedobacter puniceum]|uniref:TerB family tellurite resistance protein n=1 Tax=Pedobacter puniceum TaxID=2666136 RepID=A0A7K0FNF6_9SPHI|nr:hypothetical protein [Pedobacter puniceum]MRX46955.1 hypothetical protein [Pedobacter puniceum]